jgi:hypothetical protein
MRLASSRQFALLTGVVAVLSCAVGAAQAQVLVTDPGPAEPVATYYLRPTPAPLLGAAPSVLIGTVPGVAVPPVTYVAPPVPTVVTQSATKAPSERIVRERVIREELPPRRLSRRHAGRERVVVRGGTVAQSRERVVRERIVREEIAVAPAQTVVTPIAIAPTEPVGVSTGFSTRCIVDVNGWERCY